jgi:hypothetical protein
MRTLKNYIKSAQKISEEEKEEYESKKKYIKFMNTQKKYQKIFQ